jgi:Icc protein
MGEWPLVMITSPSDQRLIIDPANAAQVVRGMVEVRARVWGNDIAGVMMAIDDRELERMQTSESGVWNASWNSSTVEDGSHLVTVTALTRDGSMATDKITVCVNQQGRYSVPARSSTDYENAIGEWPEKHILGTQLGPNENGRHWPSRHDRDRVTQ